MPLYLPNRSTMPARACGTIRTVLASTVIDEQQQQGQDDQDGDGHRDLLRGVGGLEALASVELREGVDVGGGAADLEDLDGARRAR